MNGQFTRREKKAWHTGRVTLKLKTILNKQKICQVLQHMNTAIVFSIQYRIRSSVTVFYTEDLGGIFYHLIKLSLVFTLMTKHLVD